MSSVERNGPSTAASWQTSSAHWPVRVPAADFAVDGADVHGAAGRVIGGVAVDGLRRVVGAKRGDHGTALAPDPGQRGDQARVDQAGAQVALLRGSDRDAFVAQDVADGGPSS